MRDRYKGVRTVALDWFRDENGTDVSVVNGLSLGTTLSCVLWQGLSAICHYTDLYGLSQTGKDQIELPVDASRLRLQVARHFGEISLSAPATGELHLDEQFLRMESLSIPWSARCVRLLQSPLRAIICRRTSLYITDWVTAKWSFTDRNGISLYRRSLLKSAIPRVSRRDLRRAEDDYPSVLDEVLTSDRLLHCIKRNGLTFSEAECELFLLYARNVYLEIRPALVKATAQFRNLLAFYRPQDVFLPSDGFEKWNIIYQLCRQSGVTTHMCVDGYMCVPFWPVQKTTNGDEWLIDRACAYGESQRVHIEKQGFPPERIDVIRPPFLEYLQNQDARQHEFGAIVLTWIPYTVNPVADYSSPIRSLEGALKVLKELGTKNIAVKVKSDQEIDYVERIAKKLHVEVEILTGKFYEHVGRAPLFVGGLSTALAEVVAAGGRYVVYEPIENGYPDELVSQSVVVSRQSIARDESELRLMIESGCSSWIGDPRELSA